ncbi:hypothetical protein CTI14_47120, partial [Methylobacterium radiotolerans]
MARDGVLRILPSLKTLSQPGENLKVGFNFWHEPVKLQITEVQQALGSALAAQMPLAALAALATSQGNNASA